MANLGKKSKGKNKKKKGDALKNNGDKALQDKIKQMEQGDYQKRLAAAAKKELKDRLALEQKYSAWNRLKIQNTWRKIMRLAKVESLRKDIEVISQNHERDVDRKDAIIQMLDRDVEEAEEQYQMALRAHLQNIDTLIDLQDARLLALENTFEDDLSQLRAEFTAEREQVVKQHTKERSELLDIMAAVESDEAEKEQETRHEYEQTREMIRNKNLEDIHVLQSFLDNNIEDLEKNFETAHLNYLQSTDQRTQDFKYLTHKDHQYSDDIKIKIRKIDRLQASLQHWRRKISSNNQECSERNQTMQEEKEALSAHFQGLKGRMNKFRDIQARRLTTLTKNARSAKSKLDNNVKLAERVLVLAEMARKLETDKEKVLPFYETSVNDEAKAAAAAETEAARADARAELIDSSAMTDDIPGLAPDVPALPYQPVTLTGDGREVNEWAYLDRFFKKYNKALLDKLAMENDRARLQAENAELQSVLKQYLNGISVTEDVMKEPNPLLVVNGRITLNAPPVRHAAPSTVIEASHVVSAPGRMARAARAPFP